METTEQQPYCGYDSCDIWVQAKEHLWERLEHETGRDLEHSILTWMDTTEEREELARAITEWRKLRKEAGFKTELCEYLEEEHRSIFEDLDQKFDTDASKDPFPYTDAYECVQNCLTALMEKLNNPTNHWRADAVNLGWQHRSGFLEFEAENGKEMLLKILPKCDCTFDIYDDGDSIRIRNAHHDAPTGEFYHIRVHTPIEE